MIAVLLKDKDYFDKWKGNGSTTDTKTEDTKPGE